MCLNSTAFTSWNYPKNTSPFSYSKHFKYCFIHWARLVLQLLLLTCTCTRGKEGLQYNNLQTLVRNLPGCYSKIHQSYKYDQTAIPIHKIHFLFRSEIYKLAYPMFNDSVTFYFQDFSKSSTKPVRSGFYSFSAGSDKGDIRMRSLLINGSVLVSGVCRTGDHVALNHDVMKRLASKSWTFSECDMFWRRLDNGAFVGITGPLCLGSLVQNKGRIGVSMTVSKDQLLLTEGWYRVTDRLRLAEVKISYILQKTLRPDVYKHGRLKSHNPYLETKANKVLFPHDFSNTFSFKKPFWIKTVNDLGSDINKTHRDGNKLTKKRYRKGKKVSRRRKLTNFQQILSALTSGYEVHFLIDLAMCYSIGNVSRKRISFAGKVENFVYVRQTGGVDLQDRYINFLSWRNGVGSRGAQVIVRYVTILSDGRVKLQVFKTYPGQPFSSMMLMSSFQCRLSQGRIPYGGARFTTNPRDRVSVVADFQTLTRSVSEGVDLNVLIDLSRCHGSNNRSRHVIGSLVTDFDLVDGGKTVELSAPSLLVDSEVGPTHYTPFLQGFLGRAHINGDVNVSFISNSQSEYRNNIISSTYHCKLSSEKAATQRVDSANSVTMFRNK